MKRLILLSLLLILLPLKTYGGLWFDYYVPDEPLPIGRRAGPGSALTYGHKPGEQYGKLFYLIGDQGSYYFYWAWAKPNVPGQHYLYWQELSAPNPGIPPQPDAAICYFYDEVNGGEKVLAVFGGHNGVWCYDVANNEWRMDCKIPGDNWVGPGGSMEFWGFRRINGFEVMTFYLIKGGGYQEFWRYNRGPMNIPPRSVSYPVWERLEPFGGPDNREPFYQGADLALYHPDPYSIPLADTIFAMQGYSDEQQNGELFGLYIISQNRWYPRDELRGDANLGGAIVSHPKWEEIETEFEKWSILHCFRGSSPEFDCFEVRNPGDEGFWSSVPPERHFVGSGSDLVYGACWSDLVNPTNGIWASFGNGSEFMGFYYPEPTGSGGTQLASSFQIRDNEMIVSPNPASDAVTFRFLKSKHDAYIKIYSKSGEIIRYLKLKEGNSVWDLKNSAGRKIPSGVYFYTISIENKEKIGKITISR